MLSRVRQRGRDRRDRIDQAIVPESTLLRSGMVADVGEGIDDQATRSLGCVSRE
jgi:hypothetical protein